MSKSLVCALLATWGAAVHAASPFAQWREWPAAPQWSEDAPTLERATFAALDKDFDLLLSREEAAASRPVAIISRITTSTATAGSRRSSSTMRSAAYGLPAGGKRLSCRNLGGHVDVTEQLILGCGIANGREEFVRTY